MPLRQKEMNNAIKSHKDRAHSPLYKALNMRIFCNPSPTLFLIWRSKGICRLLIFNILDIPPSIQLNHVTILYAGFQSADRFQIKMTFLSEDWCDIWSFRVLFSVLVLKKIKIGTTLSLTHHYQKLVFQNGPKKNVPFPKTSKISFFFFFSNFCYFYFQIFKNMLSWKI